jgi:hypothetical protein
VVGHEADCIVVPVREIGTEKVVAVHCINRAGKKQTFGPTSGHAVIFGNDLDQTQTWFIVEGWADAVSMFRTFKGTCVFAALSTGKVMRKLANRVAEVLEPKRIVILEDAPND